MTRAAEQVRLAQSSVSDQIQVLETELGAELFVRTRQGLFLTPAGEARAAVETAAAHIGNSLTIGALETIGAARLPQWLGAFQRRQPDVNVHLKLAASGELMQGLTNAQVC